MSVMEIALLILGVIIFVISFILPSGPEKKTEKEIETEKEEVHRLVEQEIDGMKLRVNEATNDTVEYAVDKAERSLERVSNEKIMAVNEYAETIMEEINKNHKEVMFLYDMLSDKQTDLTNAVRKADATVKEIENMSHNAQTASETLLRGMTVASVSQKGLTQEQKSVFDDIVIPDAKPVVFEPHQEQKSESVSEKSSNQTIKPRGVALAQAKIFADMTGNSIVAENSSQKEEIELGNVSGVSGNVIPANQSMGKEKVVFDLLSGGAYSDGTVVNVARPANGSVTAADFAALVGNDMSGNGVKTSTEAPANNNDRIIALSKQGLDVVDIAKTLNLGVGEVRLVLDLFK